MKKGKKQKLKLKKYKRFLGVIILIVAILLLILLHFLWNVINPAYKIEDRIGKMEEKQEIYKEDVVGWLRVEGTNIDYPVIYNTAEVNMDQLDYDFVWTNSDDEQLGNRELILGHNVLNVSKQPIITDKTHTRFEQLMSFIYYDFAKENQYIQYSINGENYLYKIFAVGFIKNKDMQYYDKFYTKKKLKDYIEQAKKDSFYQYKVDVSEEDDILSLVTCTRFYGYEANIDFKIDARRVRKYENIMKYGVAESKKYGKIKEEMKGEGVDHEEV